MGFGGEESNLEQAQDGGHSNLEYRFSSSHPIPLLVLHSTEGGGWWPLQPECFLVDSSTCPVRIMLRHNRGQWLVTLVAMARLEEGVARGAAMPLEPPLELK